MTEAVRSYLLSVVAVSLLSSIVLALVPKGNVHRTLSFLCGLALILVTIAPIAKVDFDQLAQGLSRARISADEATTGITIDNRDLISSIIKEKTEAYILDKAAQLGCTVGVEAEIKSDGSYPYPYRVTITGAVSGEQQTQLSKEIELNLAIPTVRQEWNTHE